MSEETAAVSRRLSSSPIEGGERMDQSQTGSKSTSVTLEQVSQFITAIGTRQIQGEQTQLCLKGEFAIQENMPIYSDAAVEKLKADRTRLEFEQQSSYGKIALITCPILTCKTHYPQNSNNVNVSNKSKSDTNPKNNNNDKSKEVKRSGQEEFQLPNKAPSIKSIVCNK
ncbi:hypothetical protein TNIN_134851 [Trichonephila inaurata madagascariensis]|uniref:Uncharacterized protein n=1 Tax=Trichonephila inaurata madagascariensis TaxID=2747483 RepID=A0A8X6J3J0_9ARAC|nr:hypothetical protein TNIN_134851 [Trichonephila inaurata madagascariensis]